MHALSPGAVFCGLIGILLGRAKLFGAGAPFRHSVSWGADSVSRPFRAVDSMLASSLGTTGLTLGPDAIWSIIPLILVVIFARVFSRRVEARPFLLPVSIMVFGFLVPQSLESGLLAYLSRP
jgi:hypothetical protein